MKKKIFSTLLLVAFALASTSMFVSCKDYDDDINQKADKSALVELQKKLEADLASLRAECTAAHATFATKVELAAEAAKITALQQAVEALKTEVAACAKADEVNAALAEIRAILDGKADKAALQELVDRVNAIDEKYAELLKSYATVDYVNSIKLDLQGQIDALKALETRIAALETELSTKLSKAEFEAFKAMVEGMYTNAQIDELINNLRAELEQKIEQKISDAQPDLTAVNTRLATLETELQGLKDQLVNYAKLSDLQALEAKLADYLPRAEFQEIFNGIEAEFTGVKSSIEGLQTALAGIQDVLGTLTKEEVVELQKIAKAADELTNLAGNVNILNVLIKKRVTSIVFKPEHTYLGCEAVNAPALAYQPIIKKNGKNNTEHYEYLKNGALTGKYYDGAEMPVLQAPSKVGKTYWELYQEIRNNPWAIIKDFTAIDHVTYGVPSNAYYIVNPQTADFSKAKLSFYANDVMVHEEIESRWLDQIRTDFVVPVKTKDAEGNEGFAYTYNRATGVLTVPFKINDWENYIEQLINNYMDTVPMNNYQNKFAHLKTLGTQIALRIEDNDTAVVSDWAYVAPAFYHIMGLADTHADRTYQSQVTARDSKPLPLPVMPPCQQDNPIRHMFKTAADAINNGYTHQVAYNGSFDLSQFVETHYVYMDFNDYGYGNLDHTMTPEIFEQLGLKYVYSIVDYTEGANKTSESAHLEQDTENPSVFYPRSVTADGETITGQTATRETIYREPLIKVELQDADGNVFEAGYVKLQIVENPTPAPDEYLEFDFDFTEDTYVNCDEAITRKVTWSQMENLLLAKLGKYGYSKEQFEAEYQIDLPAAVKQFLRSEKDGKVSYTENTDPFGVVDYTAYDGESRETNIITWTVSDGTDLAALYDLCEVVDGVNTKEFITYVRFVKRVGTGPDLYIALKIPAGKLHFATGQIDNTKTLAYWFNLNQTTNAQNADEAREVRVNVPVPATSNEVKPVGTFSYKNDNLLENTEFVKDLHDYFRAGTVALALDEPTKFPSFAGKTPTFQFTLPSVATGNATFNAVNGEWSVKGISGATYKLHLSNDNLTIFCGIVPIVELDNQGAIHFIEGEIADDILNYKGHENLGELETFTAYIKMTLDDTCYPLSLRGSEWFNVRFVRPLTMKGGKETTVTDAPNNWQDIDLVNLVSVFDWRGYKGVNTSGVPSNQTFAFSYYQVRFLTDINDIVTDAHLGKDAREAVANKYRNNVNTGKAPMDGMAYETDFIDWHEVVGLELQYKPSSTTILQYKNNGAITDDFHLFVPVYMSYVFGQYKISYQNAYHMVTVKKSVDQPTAKEN